MASWKRFFNTPAPGTIGSGSSGKSSATNSDYANFSSNFREYFTGPANRLERYNQLDHLDLDPVINAALNVLAEFCTQENAVSKLPFYINFVDATDDSEVVVLKEALNKWTYINDFRKKLFYIFRNTLKYGDSFFIRDPETYELIYIDPRNVEKITVDEEDGKKILSYFIRNVSYNLAKQVATDPRNAQSSYSTLGQATVMGRTVAPSQTANQNNNAMSPSIEIDAEHVVQLSLNGTGFDFINWPFSSSVLDSIYKPAKQKELLENAYLIYRVQRAPERRAFYIYTGDMPPHKAMQQVERTKNEIHQKRLPSRSGGQSILDATYDPLSIMEDYYFPVNGDGQGPRVEMLPGGDGLSNGVDDLLYFNNQLIRGLGIPSSYIPTSGEDSQASYNDGKVGTAFIQEWRFAQTCLRYQKLFRDVFDLEFKLFLKKLGITINASEFDIEFEEPQSFGEYRQMEKDATMFGVLGQADGIDYLSKRFIMKRYGQMTEEEIAENQRLWKEENKGKIKDKIADLELNDLTDVSLNSVGIKKVHEDDEEENSEEEFMPDDGEEEQDETI